MLRFRKHGSASDNHLKASDYDSLSIEEQRQKVQLRLLRSEVDKEDIRSPKKSNSLGKLARSRRLRTYLAERLYILVYGVVQFCFSLYLWLRQAFHAALYRVSDLRHYHYRTPAYIENDVKRLEKLPEHLSVIFEIRENGRYSAEDVLVHAGEVAAWTAAAGIPLLSIYESTGSLKQNLPITFSRIQYTLRDYYGPNTPSLTLSTPNFSPYTSPGHPLNPNAPPLTVLLLSVEDGRDTIVDLTRTLAAMAQREKISPEDITADIVDAEVSESVAPEPDLLVLFGPHVKLSGYPPWQLRLTEIFHAPDNRRFGYQVFLRALRNYARAQMRIGR